MDCQFRLYDDNGPAVPHVFTTEDWFLGGIFNLVTEADYDALGLKRVDAVAFLAQLVTRFYWGPRGGPPVEMPLTQGAYRNASGPPFGFATYRLGYHIFSPGSLEPGAYEWRYVFFDPMGLAPPEDVTGEVQIVEP